MLVEQVKETFDISIIESDNWQNPLHRHNFFELIYVESGSVKQQINNNAKEYQKGNVFLLTPEDSHALYITAPSKLYFIKFNQLFFREQKCQGDYEQLQEWLKKLEYVLHNRNKYCGALVRNDGDKQYMRTLINLMITEHINREAYYKDNLKNHILTLLNIIVRNVENEQMETLATRQTNNVHYIKIMNYIQANIYESDRLTHTHLADQFNMSKTYIGEYFKKHTGDNLSQYIIKYKLKLAKTRLQWSDLSISEIADELGFTDESHFSRSFKKYLNLSPKRYRVNHTT